MAIPPVGTKHIFSPVFHWDDTLENIWLWMGTTYGWVEFLQRKKNVYTVFLSTDSNGDPSEAVLENTIGEIVWTRESAGVYHATSDGLFIEGKTAPIDDIMMDQLGNMYTLNWISTSIMELTTYAEADLTTPADDVLNSRYINIEVYL